MAVALKACTHYTIMENFKFAQTEMKSGYFAFLLQGTSHDYFMIISYNLSNIFVFLTYPLFLVAYKGLRI